MNEIKPWWQSKTIIGAIAGGVPALAQVLALVGIDISDKVGDTVNGLLNVLGLIGIVVAIYGRITARFQIGSTNEVIGRSLPLILVAALLLNTSCANLPQS